MRILPAQKYSIWLWLTSRIQTLNNAASKSLKKAKLTEHWLPNTAGYINLKVRRKHNTRIAMIAR
jgi:hypothetical protein